ncbi:hypothetical protein [Nocardioides sp. AN3]
MTATKNPAGQSLMATTLTDTNATTETPDSVRRSASQWRYGSAIEAARALNAGSGGR